MKAIRASDVVYAFSEDMTAMASVRPGSRVLFETLDALGGQVVSEEDVLAGIDFSRVNPATGPVHVEGVEPGDTLVVRIVSIETAAIGVTVTGPGMGLLGDHAQTPLTKILPIREGHVLFDDLHLPATPMVGVLGLAPRSGSFPTGTAHQHGGNMDTKEIAAGATVYLPAGQPGGLLALGDVHAVMGDGEICVSGCETAARVTVEVDRIPGRSPCWPILVTDEAVHVLVSLPTIEEALHEAAMQGVRLLQRARGIGFESATMLASLAMDLRISQLVDPNKTAKARIPRGILPADLEDLIA